MLPTPEPIIMNMDAKIDVINHPLAMHQVMTVSSNNKEMKMETYMTKEGFFLYDSINQQWIQSQELLDTVLEASKNQADPYFQLEMLEHLKEEFQFKQDAKSYILTLNTSGEKLIDFVKTFLNNNFRSNGFDQQFFEGFDFLKIDKLNYEVHLDKKTFFPLHAKMTLNFTFLVEPDEITIEQKVEANYSKYNEIQEIVVPDDVKNNAIKY